ncbi:MAG TPA: signal recognition particle protein [Vicinamibacterales bacterium]|jgi:signal recognition particle subunit SRP54|nr:signal recognition particle protein [Vicinamibacterales bacterium]
MFESLSGRLQDAFKSLRGETRLTPENVEAALREIRLALLEADVNFKVVKAFVDRVRDRAMDAVTGEGGDVLRGLVPSQQVVRIVRDEMLGLFGNAAGGLPPSTARPRVILMLGLQGAGKTTTSGKLGRWLSKQGRHPLLVSTDVKRPAAIEQLNIVGRQAGLRVHDPADQLDPIARAKGAVAEAATLGFDTVIVDTAGRLHIDDELMTELVAIKDVTGSSDRLFVADAMTGQDAIKSAGEFNARVGVTGVVLTKLDGDARGGAALSVVSVVGVPIAFAGNGETLDDLEPFHPDRVVSRVLGMGDVLSLIEKAEAAITLEDAERLEEKIRSNEFTLEDFRDQLKAIRKMGPLESIMGMLPGMGNLTALAGGKRPREVGAAGAPGIDEGQISRVEAIISSMTPDERRKQHIINGSRRKRIARGSGTSVEEVNRLLKQFVQMQKMLKQLGGMAGLAGGGRNARRQAMQMLRNRR